MYLRHTLHKDESYSKMIKWRFIKLYVYTTTDRRFAIGVFTRPRHGFPYGADWIEAPHATHGKQYRINN